MNIAFSITYPITRYSKKQHQYLTKCLLFVTKIILLDILLFPFSEIGIVKKHLKCGWDFDIDADFTTDIARAMESQLRKKFEYWNTKLKNQQYGTPFCVKSDCSDVSIKVNDNKKDYRIQCEISSVA